MAHGRFREIIHEANRPDSPIRLQSVMLSSEDLGLKIRTVISQSHLDNMLGVKPFNLSEAAEIAGADEPKAFSNPAEERVAQIARDVIRKFENQPHRLPSVSYLSDPEVRLVDFNDVAYHNHADLLYDLATKLCSTSELIFRRRTLARFCACTSGKLHDLSMYKCRSIPGRIKSTMKWL